MLGHIEASGQHLLVMISDVLDVTRIESGHLHIEWDRIDALGLVQECHQMMAPEAAAAGLLLKVAIPGDIRPVRADRTRLKQVLLNLLSNAIKYNRPNGHIILSVQAEGPWLRFAVRDTGLGMTPQQLDHLFEPFNRLGRHHSDKPGAGIGLVICKQLLELMGSRLLVHSEPEQGCLFSFDLPCVFD